MVQLSVIIPLHNRLALTQAMFASLRATLPAGLEHEIIFVDNGSTDGTGDWLKSIGGATIHSIVHKTNLGYAVANNRAVRQAGGDFVVLLNNDLVLLPDWFEPMLEVALRPGIGIVGNIQLSVRSREIDHAGVFFDRTGQPFHFRPQLNALRKSAVIESPAVTGACMLLRRAFFLELNGFDENYVNGYEDIDLCLRALSQGHRNAVATRSAAYHHVGASEGRHEREDVNAAYFDARRGEFARQLSRIEPAFSDPDAGTSSADELPFDRDAFATLQAYHPGPGGYSEQASSTHLYPTGCWAGVSLPLPRGIVHDGFTLRMDPCNFPAAIRVAGFALKEATSGNPVWTVAAEELPDVLEVDGTAKVDAASCRVRTRQDAASTMKACMTIVSNGRDPQLRLRAAAIPGALARRSDLTAELRLMTEPRGRSE